MIAVTREKFAGLELFLLTASRVIAFHLDVILTSSAAKSEKTQLNEKR